MLLLHFHSNNCEISYAFVCVVNFGIQIQTVLVWIVGCSHQSWPMLSTPWEGGFPHLASQRPILCAKHCEYIQYTWEVITWAKYLSNKLLIWKLLQSPSMPANRIRIGRWFSGSLLLTYQWTTGNRILFWKQYFRQQEIHCALQSSSLWFVISSRHFIHIHFACAKVGERHSMATQCHP